MKYLSHCLIVSFLFLAGSLSAQQYRLGLDFGTSGMFNMDQLTSPVATVGLEALINLSPRTFLVPEVGVQQTYISHVGFTAPDLVFAGFIPVDFSNVEAYKMKQTNAFMGLGLEKHLYRVHIQVFGRVMTSIAERVTFSETTNFQGSGRPDNEFSVTVKPGEVFVQDMQSGTLRYNNKFTFQSGLSVRYALTKGFELGVSYAHAIGNTELERRVISFCENCPVDLEASPERSVSAQTNTVSISGRFTF